MPPSRRCICTSVKAAYARPWRAVSLSSIRSPNLAASGDRHQDDHQANAASRPSLATCSSTGGCRWIPGNGHSRGPAEDLRRQTRGGQQHTIVERPRYEVLSLWRRRYHRQDTGVFLLQVPRWTRPLGHVWDRWPACPSPRVVIGSAAISFQAFWATTLLAAEVSAFALEAVSPWHSKSAEPPRCAS
jgi:hypothetical protein